MVDLVIQNARLWDGTDPLPRAASLILRQGRVVEIAAADVALDVQTIDVRGSVVTPGLVDAHLHLMLGGETMRHVDLSQVTDRESFEAKIEQAAASLPSDRWLVASGWNETLWSCNEPPDRSWLAVAGSRPVVCWRCDWHAVLVNDAVLERVDLSQDITGGHVGRDASGNPTGLLAEAAAWELVNPMVPPMPEADRMQSRDRAMQHLLAHGITMARTMEYRADIEQFLSPLAGELPVRLSVVQLDRELPLDTGWHANMPWTDRLRLTGCKAFFDGTLGSRTARLHTPYADAPHTRGLWVERANERLDGAWCQQVCEAGLAPVVHAIGDAAVLRALELFRTCPIDIRPTLEHAQLVGPSELAAMGGMRLSVQPAHRAADAHMANARLGERACRLLPLRDMQAAGARLSFGTDWPIVSVDPVATLRAAITGEDDCGQPFYSDQAISPSAAMYAHTYEAAEVCGFDPPLRVGADADFVVWSGDPFDNIHAASVQATVVAGTLLAGEWPQEDRSKRSISA
ncbi:MAG: amidohydrolase [Phycisphaerales bacterium]|nr:amidohydrolase [Phycisphaerales bacterium]